MRPMGDIIYLLEQARPPRGWGGPMGFVVLAHQKLGVVPAVPAVGTTGLRQDPLITPPFLKPRWEPSWGRNGPQERVAQNPQSLYY